MENEFLLKSNKNEIVTNEEILFDVEKLTDEEREILNNSQSIEDIGKAKQLFHNIKVKNKLQAVPVRVPKKKAEQKQADLKDQISEAYLHYYLVKKTAFKDTEGPNYVDNYHALSWNQKVKRKRKAKEKKVWADAVKSFAREQAQNKAQVQENEFNLEELRNGVEGFLAVRLENFRFNTDKEFSENLEANYQLLEKLPAMERLLNKYSGDNESLRDNNALNGLDMEAITKQVTFLKEIREWMDARRALMSHPYYVLLSSKEVTDHERIVASLKGHKLESFTDALGRKHKGKSQNLKNAQAAFDKMVEFQDLYEKEQNCSFKRRRNRSDAENYTNEFRAQTDTKGKRIYSDATKTRNLVRQNRIMEEQRKEQQRKDKAEKEKTLKRWKEKAEAVVSEKQEDASLQRNETAFQVQEATDKILAFDKLDLAKELKVSSVDQILDSYKENEALFQKAEEVQELLARGMKAGKIKLSGDDIIRYRAKFALLRRAKENQLHILEELNNGNEELEKTEVKPDIWASQLGLVILDVNVEMENRLVELRRENESFPEKLRELWKVLNPSRQINDDEMGRMKLDFQQNALFWETIRTTEDRLTLENRRTKLVMDKWFKENKVSEADKTKVLSDKSLLIWLEGKDTKEIHSALTRALGDEEQKTSLKLDIENDLVKSVNESGKTFRLNPDDPGLFLSGLTKKMHIVRMAENESGDVEELLKKAGLGGEGAEVKDNPALKERNAAMNFAKEILIPRMKSLLNAADPMLRPFLVGLDFHEIEALKADRAQIMQNIQKSGSLNKENVKAIFDCFDRIQITQKEAEEANLKVQKAVSLGTELNSIFRLYQKEAGVAVKETEEERIRREQRIAAISEIGTDPDYVPAEKLRELRMLCMDVLKEYAPKIDEENYYNLSNADLKNIAVRTMQEGWEQEKISGQLEAAGKMLSQENGAEMPAEFTTKESDALSLLAEITEEKQDENSLLTLITNHAEILSDLCVEKKKKERHLEELRKFNETKDEKDIPTQEAVTRNDALSTIKQKLTGPERSLMLALEKTMGEIADVLYVKLNGEKPTVKGMLKLLKEKDPALMKALKEGSQALEAQVQKAYEDVQEVVKESTREIYDHRNEVVLTGMIVKEGNLTLDAGELLKEQKAEEEAKKKEEEKKSEEKKTEEEKAQKLDHVWDGTEATRAFRELDEYQTELSKLEAKKTKLLGEAGEKVREVEELKHQFEKYDERRKLETASEEDRAYYEAKYQKAKTELEALLLSPDYLTAVQEAGKTAQSKEYQELEDQILTMQDMVESLSKKAAELAQKQNEAGKQKFAEAEKERAEAEKKADAVLEVKQQTEKTIYTAGEREQYRLEDFASEELKEVYAESLNHKPTMEERLDEKWNDRYGMGKFIKLVLNSYFVSSGEKEKRKMLSSILRHQKPKEKSRNGSSMELKRAGQYLAGMVKGAGPLLQKLMQSLPEKILSTELKAMVEDVKSNLDPIPQKYVEEKLDEMAKASGGRVTELSVVTSLGAASVAQTFLCNVKGPEIAPGTQVVVKLLRPGLAEKIQAEKEIMLNCADEKVMNDGGAMKETYGGMLSKIAEELDFTIEAGNCEKGKLYNFDDGDRKVTSVGVFDLIPASKDYMLLEKAEGQTLDKMIRDLEAKRQSEMTAAGYYYTDAKGFIHIKNTLNKDNMESTKEARKNLVKELKAAKKKYKNLAKMSEEWAYQSLFGTTGFFHGDMHAGNIMVSTDKATVLDFGNASELQDEKDEKSFQKNIKLMSIAATFNQSGDYLKWFSELLPEDSRSKKLLSDKRTCLTIRREILETFKACGDSVGEKIYLSIMVLQKYGIEIPQKIFYFSESELRLQNSIKEVVDQIVGLKNAIRSLDTLAVSANNQWSDAVLVTQGTMKGDPAAHYKNVISALSMPSKEEIVAGLKNKDPEAFTAFRKQMMGAFDDVALMQKGIKPNPDFDDEIDEEDYTEEELKQKGYYLKPLTVNTDEVRTKFRAFVSKIKEGNLSEEEERKEKQAMQDYITNLFYGKNALTAFGDDNSLFDIGAVKSTDNLDINMLNYVLDAIDMLPVMESVSQNTDELVKLKDALAKETNKEKQRKLQNEIDDLAEQIYSDYAKVQDMITDRNSTMTLVKNNLEKGMKTSKPGSAYDVDLFCTSVKHMIEIKSPHLQNVDTKEFEEKLSEWRPLYERKHKLEETEKRKKADEKIAAKKSRNEKLTKWEEIKKPLTREELEEYEKAKLTDEEEQRYQKLTDELRVESGRLRRIHDYSLAKAYFTEQLTPWFSDPDGGTELKKLYDEFRSSQDEYMKRSIDKGETGKEIEDLELKMDVAEKQFLSHYKTMALKRLKKRAEMFDEEPEKTDDLMDFMQIMGNVVADNRFKVMATLFGNGVTKYTDLAMAKLPSHDTEELDQEWAKMEEEEKQKAGA